MIFIKVFAIFVFFILDVNGSELDDLKLKYAELQLMQDHFKRDLSQLNDELIKIKNQNLNNGSNSCGNDWISYLDIKCYKVLENKGTELEAKDNCNKLSDSSLITIQSKEEQLFLSSILEKYNNISDNVWIGLEMTEKFYKWLDGNDVKYENWDENSDKKEKCVEMSITKSSSGKWTDALCSKKYLIVCQKKQNSKTIFQEELKNLTKFIENQENQLKSQEKEINELKANPIPIGFLYTQLPNQSSPQELWANMKWSEITSQYSGLFFRAEGGESLPFEQTQLSNQSHISDVYFWGCDYSSPKGDHCGSQNTSLIREKWINVNLDAVYARSVWALSFYTTSGEVRPKNTAIKIFKRIQ